MPKPFDPTLAKNLVSACLFSYDFDSSNITPLGWSSIENFQDNPDDTMATSFASLIDAPDFRILAFQGTITDFGKTAGTKNIESVLDWIQNFRIGLRPLSHFGMGVPATVPGRVHEGFGLQLAMIYQPILNRLQQLSAKPLILTGHSQGGAVAAVAAKVLPASGQAIECTYTFAAPKPGDTTFASGTTDVFRVEYGDDIVPHVPPGNTFWNRSLALAIGSRFTGVLSEFIKRTFDEANPYESLGTLIYRRDDTNLSIGVDSISLTNQRRVHLILGGSDLVEHHHLVRQPNKFGVIPMSYSTMFD